MKKYGGVYTPGTICAGDGILIPIGVFPPKEYSEVLKIVIDRLYMKHVFRYNKRGTNSIQAVKKINFRLSFISSKLTFSILNINLTHSIVI